MKHAFPLFAAVGLGACASLPAPSPSPTAAIGQWASLGSLAVRPLRLVEDSRCPVDVRCVWAGRLVIDAEIRSATGLSTRRLTLGQASPEGPPYLVAAAPGRSSQQSPAPASYRFTFALTRP